MQCKTFKKVLSFFVFLVFISIQNKSTVLSSTDISSTDISSTDISSTDISSTDIYQDKSALREFILGYEIIEEENYQWIKDNVSTVQEIVANDLSIERSKEEKKTSGMLMASITNNSNNSNHSFPSAVDNSLLKYFPPIGDQGVLGSCAAFHITYYQLTHTIAMEKDWDVKNDHDNQKKFSPKWTFNLTNSARNSSMSVFDSYKLFMDSGAARWSDFPYINDDSDPINYLEWPTNGEIWRDALNYRIEDYGYVEVWDENDPDTPIKSPESESLTNIKQLLSNGHVLTFETNITGWKFTTVGNDPLTTYDDEFEGEYIAYVNGKSSMLVDGHVMTLVSYNDDIWVDINGNGKVDPGEKGAFKVANSWGTDQVAEFSNTDFTWYSNDGFIWVAYDALNIISAVEDSPVVPERRNIWKYNNYAYWMTAKTNYTPKLLVEYTMSTSNRYNIKKVFGFLNSDTYHPVSIWDPNSINKYPLIHIEKMGFDGTTNECDATFVFDLTHLYDMYDNKEGNWYFSKIDEGNGNDGVLKQLKFIDLYNGKEYFYEENIPYDFSDETVNFGPIRIQKDISNSTGSILNKAMPFYEQYFQTVSLNDTIYTVGGHQSFRGYVNTLHQYNPNTDIWEEKSELSGQTASLIYATQFEEEIYTMRKIIENEKTKWIIEKYNPTVDAWTFLTDVDCEIVQDIITVNEEIYIIEYNELKSIKNKEDSEEDGENDNGEDREGDRKKLEFKNIIPLTTP